MASDHILQCSPELAMQEVNRAYVLTLKPEDRQEFEEARRERRRVTAICREGRMYIRDHFDFTVIPPRDMDHPAMPQDPKGAELLANCLNATLDSRQRGQHNDVPAFLFAILGEHSDLREAYFALLERVDSVPKLGGIRLAI